MTKRSWMVILCGLALGLATSVRAQNSNSGDIRGTVTDPSGGVIPGVTVTVTNSDTGVINKFVTNNDGLYDTNSILPGSYTLQFSKGGFGTLKQGPIKLEVGIITVDGTLKVGAATEVVEVSSSEEALLKTEDAQVATTISLNQLAGLPSVDPANAWTSLLKLLPGATSTPGGVPTVAAVVIRIPGLIKPSAEPCHTSPAFWLTVARSGCRTAPILTRA